MNLDTHKTHLHFITRKTKRTKEKLGNDRGFSLLPSILFSNTFWEDVMVKRVDFLGRFGADVMEVVASWTKSLCGEFSQGHLSNHVDDSNCESVGQLEKEPFNWSVLDIGTGNGLLLQELAKQG